MQLTFIGHAGFLIENHHTLLVIDPWLSQHGAYDSAWMQFPCNHHLDKMVLEKIKNFQHVYIYISHEHQDHFDKKFLECVLQVNPAVVFLIPAFQSKTFLHELRALNPAHLIEVANDHSYAAHDIETYFFIDESGINRDSGILVQAGGRRFLNLNDCKIFDRCEYIKNKFGPIDLFAMQFSGASWHPICYEMSEQDYLRISRQKRASKYRSILNAIKTLQPNRYLPTAGPPALLDPMHYAINFQADSIFPKQHDVIKFLSSFQLSTKLDSIMPGDVYSFEQDAYLSLGEERVDEGNFSTIIAQYAKQSRHFFEKNEQYTPDNLEQLFQQYYEMFYQKTTVFKIKETIEDQVFLGINELPNQYISINLNTQSCTQTKQLPRDHYYFVSYPAWQVRKLVEQQIKGEDMALTLRGRMKRSPDIYNTWISCFVNSELENLENNIKLIENIRNQNETIIVHAAGARYQIKRYCPHQGADLRYGWCEGKHWVCPKHRWHYDLENHGHCPSSNASIEAVCLAEESPETCGNQSCLSEHEQ